ncbi:hypothetical protein CBR_g12921 [Chara braunii]|uniref:Ferritin n=1 Tax=Chara braunii TaxID=69332 RepID=A0A388KTE2_CHABU|nr:hypothetical protein CBR_g12921 [Chara braunii]|eukprot:GBG73203.1 hypothetical protein CBR_g12921 [Chara braunii]
MAALTKAMAMTSPATGILLLKEEGKKRLNFDPMTYRHNTDQVRVMGKKTALHRRAAARCDLDENTDQVRVMGKKTPLQRRAAARCALDENVERQLADAVKLAHDMSYTFHAMSAYFRRDDVALPGMGKFYLERSEEERQDAMDLSRYVGGRGGRVEFSGVSEPQISEIDGGRCKMHLDVSKASDAVEDRELPRDPDSEGGDALQAMALTLAMEKQQYNMYLDVSKAADAAEDSELQHYVCGRYLHPQAQLIKKHSEYLSQLRRVGDGEGAYLFDRVLGSKVKPSG